MAVLNCAANKQMGQHLAGGPGEPLMFIVPPAKRCGANMHTVWALER